VKTKGDGVFLINGVYVACVYWAAYNML